MPFFFTEIKQKKSDTKIHAGFFNRDQTKKN